jgi:hypothetical protein
VLASSEKVLLVSGHDKNTGGGGSLPLRDSARLLPIGTMYTIHTRVFKKRPSFLLNKCEKCQIKELFNSISNVVLLSKD